MELIVETFQHQSTCHPLIREFSGLILNSTVIGADELSGGFNGSGEYSGEFYGAGEFFDEEAREEKDDLSLSPPLTVVTSLDSLLEKLKVEGPYLPPSIRRDPETAFCNSVAGGAALGKTTVCCRITQRTVERRARKQNGSLASRKHSAQIQRSRSTDPESPNGVIFILPPLLDNARHSPPPPPLEVRVAEVVVERNINLSPPSTDAVNATTTDVPLVPSSSSSAPPEVVRPRAAPTRFAGKSNEEAAAILIQTIFRAYLAKRAIRAMRGLVRLKSLMEGSVVKRQAANTLKCMQTLSRVQSQIRERRIRMSEENQDMTL
ncbi:Uncharacterized protein Rs2_14477 [Raphanus sativus]|nr:Uncharacterized protein Rs2_14477 [Raphanus sativus]